MAPADDPLRLRFLVLRCQAGDEGAFVALYGTFRDRTLGYLRSLLGDGADDAHQDLWLKVYRSIRGLADPGAFRTWLFRLTRYHALDLLRSDARAGRHYGGDDPVAAVVNQRDAADEVLDAAEVAWMLERLPAPCREVLTLRYLNDLSHAEIALILGVPVGTVRSRLHYATRAAREIASGDAAPTSTTRAP